MIHIAKLYLYYKSKSKSKWWFILQIYTCITRARARAKDDSYYKSILVYQEHEQVQRMIHSANLYLYYKSKSKRKRWFILQIYTCFTRARARAKDDSYYKSIPVLQEQEQEQRWFILQIYYGITRARARAKDDSYCKSILV